jgi:hypothetical protein
VLRLASVLCVDKRSAFLKASVGCPVRHARDLQLCATPFLGEASLDLIGVIGRGLEHRSVC